MGSTQLVTCEDTSKVKDSFWERYNMDYDVFCSTYTIEKVEITSTLGTCTFNVSKNIIHPVLKTPFICYMKKQIFSYPSPSPVSCKGKE